MSRRALGSEHAPQFSTNQSIVTEFGRALSLTGPKRFKNKICRKVCFNSLTKFQVSRLSKIVQVSVVLNWTVVVDSDRRLDNPCGSHLQSQRRWTDWWLHALFTSNKSQDQIAYVLHIKKGSMKAQILVITYQSMRIRHSHITSPEVYLYT